MIVSWNWLQDYVSPGVGAEQAADRLMMSGLNLEGIETCNDDFAIDLEVTSNRADCLGHIGVARELAALFEQPLTIPPATITTTKKPTTDAIKIENRAVDHCPLYSGRVIEGVKVGPSPDWLRERLECLGLRSVNNVVDVTNFVLLECDQPLHAFDLDQLEGGKVVVRTAQGGEKLVAIDGKTYELDEQTCVIADASRPVAIAGVMGGAETEVGEATTNLLIEVAQFAPLSVRRTARKLSLFSDSSFRFERGVDLQQLDWASRRCCELIVQVAGGTVLESPIFTAEVPAWQPPTVTLRYPRVTQLLGIDVSVEEIRAILPRLGLVETASNAERGTYEIPSWRADLTREVDLIEEVARIHGYEKIRDDAAPTVTAAPVAMFDRACEVVHRVFNASNFYEAITLTFDSAENCQLFNPRNVNPVLQVEHSSRKKENMLRPSLIPSLLQSRRANQRAGESNAQLYEIARVFLKLSPGGAEQEMVIGAVTGADFLELKGVLERLVAETNSSLSLMVVPSDVPAFADGRGAELYLNDQLWGWLGELDEKVARKFDLKGKVTVAEVTLEPIISHLELAAQLQPIPQFPAIERDFNFLLDEQTTWHELSRAIWLSGGDLLENVEFAGQYRSEQLGAGKKTYLARTSFRAADRTLTGDEVDTIHEKIVSTCVQELSAELR